MKNVTLVMTDEAKDVFLEENFLTPEFDSGVETKGEYYSIFGWTNQDEDEMEEIRNYFLDLSAMDVQYLYLVQGEDETSIGGNEYREIFAWYKKIEDMFSVKNDKIVLIRDLEDGEVISGVLVNKDANPSGAIERAKEINEAWDIDHILDEWGAEEFITEMEVQSFYV